MEVLATAVLVLRSSLTLGRQLPELHHDPEVLPGRRGAPREPLSTAGRRRCPQGDGGVCPGQHHPKPPWCSLCTRSLSPAPFACLKPPSWGCVPPGVPSSPPFPCSKRTPSPLRTHLTLLHPPLPATSHLLPPEGLGNWEAAKMKQVFPSPPG